MADSVTVKIDGLKELADKLRAMGPDLARNALRAGVRAGARVIADDAKRRAPVDTGLLRRAIRVSQIRKESNAYQQTFHVSVRAKKKGGAYYWRYVEFGTARMAAQPFLRPAFEANKERAVQAIAERLKTRIESHAKGAL